jgi:sugar phosphate isomerase/epimerase
MKLASPSLAARRKNVLYTKRLVELTYDLGGRSIVWGSGRARNIPKGIPFREGYHWLIELLRASGHLAEEKGVRIAIEPINRFESTIIHNAKEALSLARLVDCESVGMVYDTFHVSLEEDSFIGPILLAGKRVAAVHVSDCNRKIPGKGHICFPPIFDSLRKVGYDGYVTLEAILPRDPHQDLVAARRCLEKMIDWKRSKDNNSLEDAADDH